MRNGCERLTGSGFGVQVGGAAHHKIEAPRSFETGGFSRIVLPFHRKGRQGDRETSVQVVDRYE